MKSRNCHLGRLLFQILLLEAWWELLCRARLHSMETNATACVPHRAGAVPHKSGVCKKSPCSPRHWVPCKSTGHSFSVSKADTGRSLWTVSQECFGLGNAVALLSAFFPALLFESTWQTSPFSFYQYSVFVAVLTHATDESQLNSTWLSCWGQLLL